MTRNLAFKSTPTHNRAQSAGLSLAVQDDAASPTLTAAEAFLAERYGPDFRAILQLGEPGSQPHAEQDDSAFYDFFGHEPFDAAPDLTAHARATTGTAVSQ